MRQQKFLELLEVADVSKALRVLRMELTPLNQSVEKLHSLSRYFSCYASGMLVIWANEVYKNGIA